MYWTRSLMMVTSTPLTVTLRRARYPAGSSEDRHVRLFRLREIDFIPGQIVGDRCVVGLVFRVGNVVVLAGFLHADGIAVEVLVREERGHVSEVHDREVVLAEVLVDAGAATDDLLELGHRADVRVEDDELAGLCIDAGGHELRRGGDDGVRLGRD